MNNFNQSGNRDYDQTFLMNFIYPLIKNNAIIHATFNKKESHSKNFPINYCKDYKFVGEYVYYDDSRSLEHINILKNSI
jgi:hypothetical protein